MPSESNCSSQLQELDPTEVPLNFLNPRPGTPLGDRPILGPWEAVRWIALFRLALPSVILRYAGGREVTLRDLQAMGMTAGINALIVGNYLTTLGRSADRTSRCSRTCACPSAPSVLPSEPLASLTSQPDRVPTSWQTAPNRSWP